MDKYVTINPTIEITDGTIKLAHSIFNLAFHFHHISADHQISDS